VTWTKRLLWAILGLAALAVLGAVVLTQFVDPDRYRGTIETAVRDATGRELHLKGKLQLSWFPWLAITTADGQIAGAPGTPILVSWREARVGARLLPLIVGRFVIDRIRADGLVLRLHRDAAGHANWENPQPASADTSGNRPLTIAGLDLRDATLEYVDEAKGSRWQACHVDLTSSALLTQQPVNVRGQLTVSLHDAVPCASGLTTAFSAEYRTAPDGFEVHRLQLASRQGGLQFAVPELRADLKMQSYLLPSWNLAVGGGKVAGGPLRATFTPALALGTPIEFDRLSLRELAAALGVELPRSRDPTVLGNIKGTASFTAYGIAMEFRSGQLQVDDSQLKGYVRRGPDAAAPWEFDWQVDELKLERYLPERDPSKPFKFPSEDLQKLQARGHLSVATLRWQDIVARDAQVALELRDGELRTVGGSRK
jgi:AsmA protein